MYGCLRTPAAKARDFSIGRPKRVFRRDEARQHGAAGLSWRKIASALKVPMATVIEACRDTSGSESV